MEKVEKGAAAAELAENDMLNIMGRIEMHLELIAYYFESKAVNEGFATEEEIEKIKNGEFENESGPDDESKE
jgi:hypothetical protein